MADRLDLAAQDGMYTATWGRQEVVIYVSYSLPFILGFGIYLNVLFTLRKFVISKGKIIMLRLCINLTQLHSSFNDLLLNKNLTGLYL